MYNLIRVGFLRCVTTHLVRQPHRGQRQTPQKEDSEVQTDIETKAQIDNVQQEYNIRYHPIQEFGA